jgi:UDP-N-acetylmuramoyl-tripeptide--D-alanyl-D-alanine ligase
MTPPLWTAVEAAAATGGRASRDFAASGVSIDSRTVAAGDLFIALHGPNYDSHDFVAQALAKGAAAAVVERVPEQVAADAKLLIVGDTLAALTALGRAARQRSRAKIIAVTGSVGKTGTKEALRLALSGQGATHASASSFNNHWGVPLTLALMPRDTVFGVLELGMNHAGELAELSLVAHPHVAIVTTIEAAHLGHFASIEAIADAKAEIFIGIEPGGAAILNRDNPHFARLAAAAREHGVGRIIGFGEHREAVVRLVECQLAATASTVVASVMGEAVRYTLPQPGRHWVMNSLAVLAAVKAIGADVAAAAAALGQMPGLAGRGKRHRVALPGGSFELIDESYNANPASMRAAIAVLGASDVPAGGRRIAVLGTMLELGPDAARLHGELAQPLVEAGIDLVFTVGGDMEKLRAALPEPMRGEHRARSSEMALLLATALRPGDVVTVKGSLGSRMAEIVKPLLAGSQSATPPGGAPPRQAPRAAVA